MVLKKKQMLLKGEYHKLPQIIPNKEGSVVVWTLFVIPIHKVTFSVAPVADETTDCSDDKQPHGINLLDQQPQSHTVA